MIIYLFYYIFWFKVVRIKQEIFTKENLLPHLKKLKYARGTLKEKKNFLAEIKFT